MWDTHFRSITSTLSLDKKYVGHEDITFSWFNSTLKTYSSWKIPNTENRERVGTHQLFQ